MMWPWTGTPPDRSSSSSGRVLRTLCSRRGDVAERVPRRPWGYVVDAAVGSVVLNGLGVVVLSRVRGRVVHVNVHADD